MRWKTMGVNLDKYVFPFILNLEITLLSVFVLNSVHLRTNFGLQTFFFLIFFCS